MNAWPNNNGFPDKHLIAALDRLSLVQRTQ